jgi:hypothetical protein
MAGVCGGKSRGNFSGGISNGSGAKGLATQFFERMVIDSKPL